MRLGADGAAARNAIGITVPGGRSAPCGIPERLALCYNGMPVMSDLRATSGQNAPDAAAQHGRYVLSIDKFDLLTRVISKEPITG